MSDPTQTQGNWNDVIERLTAEAQPNEQTVEFVREHKAEVSALLRAYNVAGEAITDYLCEHYPDNHDEPTIAQLSTALYRTALLALRNRKNER